MVRLLPLLPLLGCLACVRGEHHRKFSQISMLSTPVSCSLEDVVHEDRKLYLVFEFLDVDLKKHMDSNPQVYLDQTVVKVRQLKFSAFLSLLVLAGRASTTCTALQASP